MGGDPWRKCWFPLALIRLVPVCITLAGRNALPGFYMFLLQRILGEGWGGVGGFCVITRSTIPDKITHSHITSTCLLCCITGSKEKRPFPKIKKIKIKKKAVRLMRTRSGSERYRIEQNSSSFY